MPRSNPANAADLIATVGALAHEHSWRLINLDFECGGVREYLCDSCSASWFA
jgi:hypothetical protein